ncbi:MAG: hypothetical protein HFH48_01535 [Lachnospiraceae bacterium]|nr:hypothetical protein [Lachnospiraceae bacterium]
MKNNRNLVRSLQWMFGLLLLGMLLYFVLGELFLPEENKINAGACKVFEAEWKQKMPDGSYVSVEVPGICETDSLDSVCIETSLPENLEDKMWMCLQSSRQDMEIYIDGELRQKYTTEHTRLFGKNSAGAYIFQELKQEDAGKRIQIVTISDSAYNGRMDTIYLGDRTGIFLELLSKHGIELGFAAFTGILCIITIVFSVILRHYYSKMIQLDYLAWGIFLSTVCMMMASRLRQFLLPNVSVASGMAFFSIMLMPMPFLIYFNSVQKHRYQKCYLAAGIAVALNLVVCTALQLINWKDFSETSMYTMAIIVFAILIVWITMGMDTYRGNIREYRLSAIGFLGVSVGGILEIVLAYQQKFTLNGIILCGGSLFHLMLSIVETGQRVFLLEGEKQKAIFANELKGKFLLNMSREMQSAIDTVIKANERILKESRGTLMGEYARNIQSAGKMLKGLTSDMMDFSSMDVGNLELVLDEYVLNDFVEDAVHLLKGRAQEKNLEIRLNIGDSLPEILKGDESRIRKILISLFSNSVKYTQEGAITFSVQGRQSDRGEFVLQLSVADTGSGMEKEKLTDIFDITSKWREEHTQEGERTGLDLHMVKQLVEKMQGRIKVWSLEGKGSLFTVEIPQEIVERSFAVTENRQETPEKKEWIEQKVGMAYCGEDEKMYREVLQAYCQQGKKYCQEIPDLLDREDWKNYGIAVHAIKSTSMTIGAVFLSEKAKQQELAAKENHREDVMKGQEEFFQTYQCVLREAEKMLKTWEEESKDAQRNSLKSAGGRKFSEDYLGECRTLLEYVRNYEMSEALEQAEKLLEMEPVEMPRQVQAFVNEFEYEQAEKYLLEWIEEQECIR